MANQLLTIGMITRESLMVLENLLRFTKRVTREYDKEFGVAGAQIGTVLSIRKPPKYLGRYGDAIQVEDATETMVQLALTSKTGVDIAFTTTDLTLNIDDFQKRFIRPGLAKVANNVDADGLLQYLNVWNFVGIPGSVPNALLTYLQGQQKLDEEATPRDELRTFIITPGMNAVIVDALKGLFQSSEEIAGQYEEGLMGRGAGGDWYMSQNVQSRTTGAQGGSPVVSVGGQSGATLTISGATGNVTNFLNPGDKFTIGSGATGCFAANTQSKQSTGALRCFTVTAPVSTAGGGTATIPINPAIILSGAFQNVVAAPANGASINISGAAGVQTPQALVYHELAFAIGCADLVKPEGVWEAAQESDDQLGLAIRLIKQYDINSDRVPTRLDFLYGWTTLYGELACVVQS